MGTSIQVGEGDGIYRMHIHVPTDKRYEPIDYTMELGTITKVHIENLMIQVDGSGAEVEEPLKLVNVGPDDIAVIVVSPGIGFSRIFASLGAASIVEGGQTMNPSTQEILGSFEDLPTDKVIILPHGSKISGRIIRQTGTRHPDRYRSSGIIRDAAPDSRPCAGGCC